MFVKICGITNEDDALFAVAMGADAVGFMFAPSPRQIARSRRTTSPAAAAEILTVGVFRDELPGRGRDRPPLRASRPSQLHGNETPEQTLRRQQRPLGDQGVRAGSTRHAPRRPVRHRHVLVDAPAPGSGKSSTGVPGRRVPPNLRVILAGGLDPENVADAMQVVEPWGVDVATGVEAAPGKKDPPKVKRFIDATPGRTSPTSGPDELPYDWADE